MYFWLFVAEVSLCFAPSVIQPPGDEEDGFLSDVGSRAEFRLSVLFQSHVPALVLVFLRLVRVVVVLLQSLQEVTFISYCGLREKQFKQHLSRTQFEIKLFKVL